MNSYVTMYVFLNPKNVMSKDNGDIDNLTMETIIEASRTNDLHSRTKSTQFGKRAFMLTVSMPNV